MDGKSENGLAHSLSLGSWESLGVYYGLVLLLGVWRWNDERRLLVVVDVVGVSLFYCIVQFVLWWVFFLDPLLFYLYANNLHFHLSSCWDCEDCSCVRVLC